MFGGATPSIVGSRVHRQSESGGLVPLIGSHASTIQLDIEGIDSDGEESKLKRGVMVMVATLGSNPSYATSTSSRSSAHSGFTTEVHDTGSPALLKGSSIRFI